MPPRPPTTTKPFARMTWRVVAGAIIALSIVNIALALWLPAFERSRVIAEQREKGRRQAERIMAGRNYYIETVLAPILLSHAAESRAGDHPIARSIPEPTEFAQAFLDRVLKGPRAEINIVSAFPWETKKTRVLTPFQQSAWDRFQIDPDDTAWAVVNDDGVPKMHVALADRMVSTTCLSCHNVDQASPKRDWRIGDVSGITEIIHEIAAPLLDGDHFAHHVIATVSWGSLALAVVMLALERAFAWRRDQQLGAEAHIRFLAFHDPMTGLLNRARVWELCVEVLEASTGRAERPAIYLVDLDHFKQVNDGYGHAAGDAVICIAADRLRAVVDPDSLVARLGGDEFVIIQPASASLGDVQRTASDIVAALAQPYNVGGKQFSLSATVGVRICPTDATDTTQLYKAADRALYKAKQAGRNGFAIYDDALHRALTERRTIEQRLRVMASDPHACGIVYQPLCDVHYGEVRGFEALMRLGNGDDCAVSPEVFIPIAEDLGLIADLGANILNRALAFAMTLPDPMTIAVNVSPRQFFAADPAQSIVEVTRRALAATGFPPHRLELEITEGLFLKVTDEVTAQLNGLKALGVKLVLDDFGVGYCSLGYLAKFPVDKLKIDKSFLSEAIEQPERILPILSSIAALGQTLGLDVVAEGIESPEQARIAERVGCQQLQGFYFCRPIYEADVAAYILCNRIGTQKIKSDCQLSTPGSDGGFWSLLAWIQTSGTWSPVIAKAS